MVELDGPYWSRQVQTNKLQIVRSDWHLLKMLTINFRFAEREDPSLTPLVLAFLNGIVTVHALINRPGVAGAVLQSPLSID